MGLGHNNPVKMFALYPVPGVKDVVAISTTETSAYAVLADGRILAWGSNSSGELGNTTLAEFEKRRAPQLATPTPVAAKFDAVDVSAKRYHVLALARDGSVWAWGNGESGELGIGPPTWGHVPKGMSQFPIALVLDGLAAAPAAVR
jgi:alpha-tubulin suppressor-like RCC1 family protein